MCGTRAAIGLASTIGQVRTDPGGTWSTQHFRGALAVGNLTSQGRQERKHCSCARATVAREHADRPLLRAVPSLRRPLVGKPRWARSALLAKFIRFGLIPPTSYGIWGPF